MGNKHALAPDVAKLVKAESADGPLVDAFAGMCSIAARVAPTGRQVCSNDVQRYAELVARCQLASQTKPLRADRLATILSAGFSANLELLKTRFERELEHEKRVLAGGDTAAHGALVADWQHVGNNPLLAVEAAELASDEVHSPYRMCTITFAHGYFGLRQAMEIDSLRCAIDGAVEAEELNRGQKDWALLALLQAASICASTPGHFAQYLRPNDSSSIARIVRQRHRSPWQTFLDAADDQRPFGTWDWRAKNRVYRSDALLLWPNLDAAGIKNAIVYADPPYGKDQYSRYYHVLESLVRYDYPQASGMGRYRPNRFTTPFSLKTKVVGAFEDLFGAIAERDWTLILSYPDSGLLHETDGPGVDELLNDAFNRVEKPMITPFSHSTLGGRHGNAQKAAEEHVWVAC